jgi:anti-sigma B factor antagonist
LASVSEESKPTRSPMRSQGMVAGDEHGRLRVHRSHPRQGIDVCTVIGEVDLCTAPLLQHALLETEHRHSRGVVVDLSQVSFLAVAGVRVLAAAAEQADVHQHRFAVVVTTRPVKRMLELTHLDGYVDSYPSLAAAVHASTAADRPALPAGPAPGRQLPGPLSPGVG